MKKESLITVYVEKKFLLAFRILMLSLAIVFFIPVWNCLDDGYVISKGEKRDTTSMVFFLYILKYLAMSMLFLWLGTGGAKEKNNSSD